MTLGCTLENQFLGFDTFLISSAGSIALVTRGTPRVSKYRIAAVLLLYDAQSIGVRPAFVCLRV